MPHALHPDLPELAFLIIDPENGLGLGEGAERMAGRTTVLLV